MENRICFDGAACDCADNVAEVSAVRRETDEGFVLLSELTVEPCLSDRVEMGHADPVGANVLVSNGSVDVAVSVELDLTTDPSGSVLMRKSCTLTMFVPEHPPVR